MMTPACVHHVCVLGSVWLCVDLILIGSEPSLVGYTADHVTSWVAWNKDQQETPDRLFTDSVHQTRLLLRRLP